MYCQNCGIVLEIGTAFCGSCGANQNLKSSAEMKDSPATPKSEPNPQVEQVKSFFKNNLGSIIASIFGQPIKGTLDVFLKAKDDAYRHAMILIVSTGILYTFLPYLFSGDTRDYIGFNNFLKVGFGIIIVLLLVSSFTWVVKSISGRPDFKKELLTGGLCGIPLSFFLIISFLFIKFIVGGNPYSYINNPQELMRNGIALIVVYIYLFLLLINIVQQSFKASDTNDGLSWYISPLVVCFAFYIGFKISMSLFSR